LCTTNIARGLLSESESDDAINRRLRSGATDFPAPVATAKPSFGTDDKPARLEDFCGMTPPGPPSNGVSEVTEAFAGICTGLKPSEAANWPGLMGALIQLGLLPLNSFSSSPPELPALFAPGRSESL
jgi:hypothetical protein